VALQLAAVQHPRLDACIPDFESDELDQSVVDQNPVADPYIVGKLVLGDWDLAVRLVTFVNEHDIFTDA